MINVQVNTQIDEHSDTKSEAQNLTVKEMPICYIELFIIGMLFAIAKKRRRSIQRPWRLGQKCLVTIADTEMT